MTNYIQSMRRIIPATMATQHPDNASAPYWETDGDGFVNLSEELTECVSAFQDLVIKEFMWDWEGKYADEAIVDKLFAKHYGFFKKNQLGRDLFLTFRVPNIWHEKGYSLLRALMVVLTGEDFACDLRFKQRPLLEVILPMTENARQLIYIQKAYHQLANFKHRTFNHCAGKNNNYLHIIPLVESVEKQMSIKLLLDNYLSLHQKYFHFSPPYLRPFLARSDPAMVSGLLANVLANKIALSEIALFSRERRVPTYPIIGAGSLPFRGGLNPANLDNFLRQYAGARTMTIQSAFRYDYPLQQVRNAIMTINKRLAKKETAIMSEKEKNILRHFVVKSGRLYQKTISGLLKDMTCIFAAVPKRRERKLHVGFLSYGRRLQKTNLPRAITFTAGFYSLGVPPELIATGRSLALLTKPEFNLVLKYYPALKENLDLAGHYLNKENLRLLIKKNNNWRQIARDVEEIENTFSFPLQPRRQNELLHHNLTAQLLLVKKNKQKTTRLIGEMGKLRRSLG